MEIKVGDKVRVSKDAPRIYVGFADVSKTEFIVGIIDDGVASVHLENDEKTHAKIFVIPTKYLIKVDAEAKFKVGDKVIYIGENQEFKGRLFEIDGEIFYNDYHRNMQVSSIKCKDYNVGNVPLSDLEPYIEPTAPTIKVGDKVKVAKNAPKVYIAGVRFVFTEIASTVTKIDYPENNPKDQTLRIEITPFNFMEIPSIYVERVENEAQTEAVKTNPDNFKKIAEEWANEVSNAIEEYGDAMCKIYVEAHNEAYWDAYAADLAKEIALKVANKYSDPKEAAEYAVSVAKAVVENLKKK